MAHITNTLQPHFTGHVGPVRFINGHADTDDTDLLEFFHGQPDVYDVQADEDDTDADPEG
jgi:hypothetical protein